MITLFQTEFTEWHALFRRSCVRRKLSLSKRSFTASCASNTIAIFYHLIIWPWHCLIFLLCDRPTYHRDSFEDKDPKWVNRDRISRFFCYPTTPTTPYMYLEKACTNFCFINDFDLFTELCFLEINRACQEIRVSQKRGTSLLIKCWTHMPTL